MAVRLNLDVDTLRTLVVAQDCGGLTQAAAQLGRTPSAISLQMKRLQQDLGIPLFRRSGRSLKLTEAGETALSYARRVLALNDELVEVLQGASIAGLIRIGCPQDFAWMLPPILAHFTSVFPRMQIELQVEGNAALLEAVHSGRLDIAVVVGLAGSEDGQLVGQLQLVWIAAAGFEVPAGQALPLALLGPQCAFRRTAIQRLESAGVAYRIAATSPGLNGLWAALLGGIGITARTALGLPEGLHSAPTLHGLPPLGSLPVTLHRRPRYEGAVADRMTALLTDALSQALRPAPTARRTKAATAHR